MVGDPDRLQQIVWNLLSNAVKFTPSGGTVHVTAERVESAVSIRVQDTGAGILPQHLSLIFERFHQIDSTTTRAHGGLGLGLAIVRHLVEAHGGTADAQSEGVGEGALFTVTLPLRAVFAEPEPTKTDGARVDGKATPVASIGPSLRGARILIVDDDEDSLDLLRVVLEGAGAAVTAASNAPSALEGSLREEFDMVISDIGMPEMDGYAFMRTLRARSVVVPAIALTAYARAEDVEQARLAGYHQHFSKPVDASKLVATIARLLQPIEV